MVKTATINSVISFGNCQTNKIMDQIASVTVIYQILKDRDTVVGHNKKIGRDKNVY